MASESGRSVVDDGVYRKVKLGWLKKRQSEEASAIIRGICHVREVMSTGCLAEATLAVC